MLSVLLKVEDAAWIFITILRLASQKKSKMALGFFFITRRVAGKKKTEWVDH